MDVSDRDEKLRLARKKLGKFQKNKTKLAAVGAEPASSIDAGKTGSNAEGSVAETAQSPRVNLRPVSPSVYAVHHPLNSHSSVHPGHSPSAQSPTKSISHSSQDMSSGGIQNHQNDIKKRSMFTSFVSAVTNTAASIMNTDDQQGIHNQHNQQELDNARNALAAAKEERRSRSSSPMRFRSPSPARNAVTNTTGGVFGMASRLFTTAASSSQSQSTPNAHLYSDQYSNQNHQDHNTQQLHVHDDYQYGQQEGRDFGIGLEGSGYGVGTYSDPTSYQYKSNQSQLVDPSAYYQQDHMQQGQEHTQPVQQQQSFEHLSHHSFETAQYQHDQQPQPQQISSNGYQNNEMYAQYPDQYQMQQQLQQPYIDEQQDYYASDNTATSIGYYNDALVQDHAHNQNYYDVGYTQQAAYYEHQQYRSHEVPQFSDVNDGFQQQELYARQQSNESVPMGTSPKSPRYPKMPWNPDMPSSSASHDSIPVLGTLHQDAIPGFDMSNSMASGSVFDEIAAHSSRNLSNPTPESNAILSSHESLPLGSDRPDVESNDNVLKQEIPSPVRDGLQGFPSVISSNSNILASERPSRSPTSQRGISPLPMSTSKPRTPSPQRDTTLRTASPNPFAVSSAYDRRISRDFPISGGLQTWPTSPNAIQQTLSQRPSSSSLSLQQSHQRRDSASRISSRTNPTPMSQHAAIPQAQESEYGQYNQEPVPAEFTQTAAPFDQYLAQHGHTQPEPEHTSGMIQINSTLYKTILNENDALMRQQAVTQEYVNTLMSARLSLEQRCADLEAERDLVLADVALLKQTVGEFGDLDAERRRVEEAFGELAERERAVAERGVEIEAWATRLQQQEGALANMEEEVIVRTSSDADAHLRLRIEELESSRVEFEALQKGLLEREKDVERELTEAVQLKEDSGEALQRVEASVARIKEREEESIRIHTELEKERADAKALRAELEDKQVELDGREHTLGQSGEVFRTRLDAFEHQLAHFERDRKTLEDNQHNHAVEMHRLNDLRHSLEVQQSRLRDDQDLLRQREIEVRARQDEFLAESSNMANREAMQLAELRREYDHDVERLRSDQSDLQERELQLSVLREDTFQMQQRVNEDRARILDLQRDVEAEKNTLTKQAEDIQEAQSSLKAQQQSLDEAVATFAEMKEYIQTSMADNEAHIRKEFESVQQAHSELKRREEESMKELENERRLVAELQMSVENERRLLLEKEAAVQHSTSQSGRDDEVWARLEQLEHENAELRSLVNDASVARAQDASHISELEDSNHQLQKNVLHLTNMIETGSAVKKPAQVAQSDSFISNKSTEVDERVEFLERRVEAISKEEGTIKEAAEKISSTYNDFKKFWNEAAPVFEGIKALKETGSTHTSATSVRDRSHLWTRQEAEALQDAAAGATLSATDYDKLVENKSSFDLMNVIVSLTSTNQNLSRKLDETLTQVQHLQAQGISPGPINKRTHPSSAAATLSTSASMTAPPVKGILSRRESAMSDLYSTNLETDSSIHEDHGHNGGKQRDESNVFAGHDAMSSYRNGSRDILTPAPTTAPRYSQKAGPVYPSAKSMTKVTSSVNPRFKQNRSEESIDENYPESPDSESESSVAAAGTSIQPSNSRIPFSLATTPTSQPMARVPEYDASSPETPRANSLKRSTAPPVSASYYTNPVRNYADVGNNQKNLLYGPSRLPSGTNGTSSSAYVRPHSIAYDRHEDSHVMGTTSSAKAHTSRYSMQQSARRQVSLEGLRTYFTEKDLESLGEPAQKVMFGESPSGAASSSSKYANIVRKDVSFGGSKAKSDTEGVSGGWGGSRGGLRSVSSTGNRTESIRDVIRARIRERDLGGL